MAKGEDKTKKIWGVVQLTALALFVLAIVFSVTYIGTDYLRKITCESINELTYEGGKCLNASGGTEQTLTAITAINTVELAIDIALGLLGLIVLIVMFAIIIRTAKSMN